MPNPLSESASLKQAEPKPTLTSTFWANALVKIPIASAVTTTVTTPIINAILNVQREGQILPKDIFSSADKAKTKNSYKSFKHPRSHFLLASSFFMRGLRSQIISGQQRGAVSLAASNSTSRSEDKQPNIYPSPAVYFLTHPLTLTFAFSQADVIAAQVFSNKGKLEAIGLINKGNFTWSKNNFKQLFSMSYPVRATSNFVHFSSLCFLAPKIKEELSGLPKPIASFIGGACAGALATIATSPLSFAMDDIVVQTTMDKKGQLKRCTTGDFLAQKLQGFKNQGFLKSFIQFALHAKIQLPLRVFYNATACACILGMDSLLGDKPLETLASFKP